MMAKHTWQIVLLGAGLTAAILCGNVRAADEPTSTPAKTDQPSTEGRRPRFDPAEMLKNYRDQFEGINLTDDQMKKIDGFLTTAEASIKPLLGKDDEDSRTQRREAFQKLRDNTQAILTETQKTALRQKMQAAMVDRSRKEYTKPELKLTDDQLKKVNAVFDDVLKQVKDLSPAGGDDRENMRKAFGVMRASRTS